MDKISLIIPCYNEELAFPIMINEVTKLMDRINYVDFEILLIDNCSEDRTLELMKEIKNKDNRFKYISFSRNFGKDASMYAGLKHSTGDYVAIMDCDLQDPPELLEEMYKIVKNENYDSVLAVRSTREGEPFLRSLFAKIFYKLMQKISMTSVENGARDFRLMTRQMVDAVLTLDETQRFTKGIFSFVGFKTKNLFFKNKERVAGKTKLPMTSAFRYAFMGIVSFSTIPLLITSIIGTIIFIIAIIYTLKVIINQLFFSHAVPGYSSLMCVVLFGFGITLLMLGIIGQYLAQMYLEIKHRPKYIIKESSLREE